MKLKMKATEQTLAKREEELVVTRDRREEKERGLLNREQELSSLRDEFAKTARHADMSSDLLAHAV